MRKLFLGAVAAALAAIALLAAPASSAGCGYSICLAGATSSSLASASAAAAAGATLTVQPGTYPAQTILAPSTKNSGPAVVFEGAGVTISGDLTLGSTSACNGAQNLTFRNFAITGEPVTRCGSTDITLRDINASAINLGGGNGIQVIGGDFGPNVNGISEIKNGASNVLIESAVFHDYLIDDPAKHSECLMVWGSGVTNLRVHNTIFRNCTDFDVLVKASSSSGIVFDSSFFDVPMPGNVATTTCNPDCPRDGTSLRFSTYSYPNSAVTNNVMNGGLTIDCGCVTRYGNTDGTIPDVPPGTEPPPPPPDTTAPSAPAGLAISAPSASAVTLSWQAATDDTAVMGYTVLLDGVQVADVADPTVTVSGLAAAQHVLTVEAYDAAGNVSAAGSLAIYRTWRG